MPGFFPKGDYNQTLRIKRFLMAVGSYFMWFCLLYLCILQGITRVSIPVLFASGFGVFVMNAGIYFVFRSGLNKRFKDRSLTLLQMLLATAWCMVIVYYADEARNLILLSYLVVFVFGLFRLTVKQFLFLSAFTVFSYTAVIFLLSQTHPEFINPKIDFMNIIVLATVLPWFSLVGGYIARLRKEIAKALLTIERLAITDDLTQVFNRRQMFNILENQKALGDRGAHQFSVCIFDLDDFKKVNDLYGHEKGDIVLKTIAQAVQQNLRDIDQIARYGGEEFVLILPDSDVHLAMICAQRVQEMAKKIRFEKMPEEFRITISVGVAEYNAFEPVQDTINRADNALYRAKKNGRDRVEYEECKSPVRIFR